MTDTNTFNTRATQGALDKFVGAERDARGAMDAYATKLGAEFARCDVTAKSGPAFKAAREQFYEAYGRRNGKLGLIREAQKHGGDASDDARRAIGAAAKMWQKVSSAAIEGTTVEAQQDRNKNKAARAKGSKSPVTTSQRSREGSLDTLSHSGEGDGKPTHLSVVTGIGEEAAQMAKRVESGEMPTEKQLAAFCKSILAKAEIVTGRQIKS